MIPYKQLSLADIFQDCQNKFDHDKPAFLSLLETHIDIDEFIPISFRNHFYTSTGRSRKYPLRTFLWALIIQCIFSLPTDQLLLTFLAYSKPLRDFCGFTKVPDASKITRFKQDFLDDLQLVFDNLVDITEPLCQAIDSTKPDMTIFDSSGIEAFVTENNPKYANRIIRQLKAYAKAKRFDKNYDPYKAAYGSMPSHASANPEIKQLYINGHFCYVFKFGIITNSNSERFLFKASIDNPKTFLGDAAFDTAALYPKFLTGNTFGDNKHFDKAYIPLNSRASLEKQDYTINENGIPCCPHDDSLPMKYEGISKLRSGVTRYKFVCPKIRWTKNESTDRYQRHCTFNDPCTTSSCGRMVYIYPEKDLRAYPGAVRGTEEWNSTYKIRTTVERDINHIKDNLCLTRRRTQNEKTLHADLILAGITNSIKSMAYLSAPKTARYPFSSLKSCYAQFCFYFGSRLQTSIASFAIT